MVPLDKIWRISGKMVEVFNSPSGQNGPKDFLKLFSFALHTATHQIHDIHRALCLSYYCILDGDGLFLFTGKGFVLPLHLQRAD